MSSLLRGFGLFLLPLCGWLVGDAVQAKTTLHLAALQRTIELLQRVRQEIQYRRADLQKTFAAKLPVKALQVCPAVHCSSCLHRGSFRRQNAPASQNVSVVLAVQRPHRNANGWITIRRGSRTICSRHAAQHSGRPVCRTVWDWQAA